ncbi:NAD(P)H-binding protein [Saccharopolyspora sp. HNM0983]|uniref:NAD(P)H-binding protein n=1 Tax=Saccharopolyspora montiporae TaxID=2781240 RepID=A0A929B7L0_9PSEU|nr:NAD(P)H-binding protein [Saccharopolyspora sp. HNM0983]MBE9373711.1 NAD(P)H-binding protein [Saccharopolyspora sp. HNM0983]
MPLPILVTGGTGTLGRAVVARLAEAGRTARVLSRSERSAVDAGCDRVRGDLRTGAGLADAVAGSEVIVHCATTNGRGDVAATRNLLHAAGRGHPHVVYISIVGSDRIPLGYYRAKQECERLLETGSLPWTILRATQFHDLLAALFAAQRRSPVTLVPAATPFQPIDVRDVAAELTRIAERPPAGRVPDIGGPQVRTAADLARSYRAATGRRGAVLPVALPGRLGRGFRRGWNLVPDGGAGTTTFEEFLTGAPAPPR